MDEIRTLNDTFSKLEADKKIAKNINNLLSQRVVDLERQCWANAQYSRRECLKIVGIPRSVNDNSLEEKVIQVFEKVGCNIESSNTEAGHCITKKNNRVKKCYQKESSKIKNGGHSGEKQIFINHSLCPYYHVLWSKSKILLNMGKINRLMVSNETLKVKISDISAQYR